MKLVARVLLRAGVTPAGFAATTVCSDDWLSGVHVGGPRGKRVRWSGRRLPRRERLLTPVQRLHSEEGVTASSGDDGQMIAIHVAIVIGSSGVSSLAQGHALRAYPTVRQLRLTLTSDSASGRPARKTAVN